MKFFNSEKAAVEAAVKLSKVGLTGSGQQCGPEYVSCRGWFYWTAHGVFNGVPIGEIILADGILAGEKARQFRGWLAGYEDMPA